VDQAGREGGREGGGHDIFCSTRSCTYTFFSSLPPSLQLGRSTLCIVLTEEATEDSNVRMNKVGKEGGREGGKEGGKMEDGYRRAITEFSPVQSFPSFFIFKIGGPQEPPRPSG
jgi:hypothetical protein